MKKALITGITGQDGSYLAELLLSKGYEVHGIIREGNSQDLAAGPLHISIYTTDITNYLATKDLIGSIKPDEIYHLAAQSNVAASFNDEIGTLNTNINSTHCILSSIKEVSPESKFYFAASSEMFGRALSSPQNEATPFNPVSPYGISKVTGFYLTRMFREAYGVFACSGILFNHESPRRGSAFVTRRITQAVARIKSGIQKDLVLGNLAITRDWGFAPDYVRAMWMMLQQHTPDDYVIGTGESHSIKDFLTIAFGRVGLNWEQFVRSDPSLFRPIDISAVLADNKKARMILGWVPTISFTQLVELMVDADLKNIGYNNPQNHEYDKS
jgi:GDPmannose 4,6-dehydratase